MNAILQITDDVVVPESELSFTFSTSSGPGGQYVNKVSTRATLHFDVTAAQTLSERQKVLVMHRLRTRITKDGVLRVVSQRHRSQRANREAARERFVELLREALHEKHRSRLKQDRARPRDPE